MIKKIGFATLIILLQGCQQWSNTSGTEAPHIPSGIVLVKDNTESEERHLPYRKFQLTNGLTVVLHQDHSDPLVHVDITYHVGSSREELGKSGFAHFFEHMMFQGSQNVADEQHFKIITEAGGNLNGTTNNDRTNYYQTVPANQLEKVLWLEADRMGYLLPAVTQEKFEVQRETVKNERAQRVDNQPYGLRSERIAEALFPSGHPYSWPVIGYVEDLDRVDVNDLKAFFTRWYGPNNAVLTIGGDFNEAQTLAWIQKYFGNIPKGQEVSKLDKPAVTLVQDRYLTIEDDVHLPLLQLTFPTVYVRHEDEAPLDVLSDILGGGKTSLFYKNLVREGYAVHAGVGHPCQELACAFELISLPNPSKIQTLSDLEQIVRDTLVEFEARGVKDDDLLRTKASIRSGTIYGLQSVAGKVSTLAYNQVFADEPDLVQYDLDRYNNVTKEDVMRVFRKYIKNNASVVLSIVPQGQLEIAAKSQDYQIPERLLAMASTEVDSQTVAAEPVNVLPDTFDRGLIPVPGPNPPINIPDYWQHQLDNGIEIMGHQTTETPTVSITLNMEGGPLLDSKEQAGLAVMTAAMMSETTENFSNEDMANELRKLGSSISFSAAGRYTFVQVSSLTENIDKTLTLLQEKLLRPAFLEVDFLRLQQRMLQSLQQAKKNPEVLASNAVSKVLYGDENRISLPDSGTMESLTNINLKDIKQFYERYYNASLANIIIVGDVSQKQALEKIAFLNDWPGSTYEIAEYQPFPEATSNKIYLVNDMQAEQSIIKVFNRSLPYDAFGEHFKLKLMNFPLGGMFNSRLNLNLREDKGYTYGARSGFQGGKTLGRFEFSSAVNKQHTVAALNEVLTELTQYQSNGMTLQELALMRNAYTQSDALRYETPRSKASYLRHISAYNLPSDLSKRQNALIESISREELNALAKKHIEINNMEIVIVGNQAEIGDDLEEFAVSIGRELAQLEVMN